ncbi:MAG: glycosyltransferase family 4 protein [bacterium]|nr:glycosyltransferase family 4 protein [bacterium]
MRLALLQESAVDGADYNQFHRNLVAPLSQQGYSVNLFEPVTEGWEKLDFLGPICRAFSLSKFWQEISKSDLIYGSPMNSLPFLESPSRHVVNVTYVAEALKRIIDRPEYGEEVIALKKNLEEAKSVGINFENVKEEYYRIIKEAQETICRTKFSLVVPNRNAKEDLIRYYDIEPQRITVIPYGVEEDWFTNQEPCSQCDGLFSEIDRTKPLLIYYADLHHGLSDFLAQGVDRIMETFQRIRELQKLVILSTNDPAYKRLFQKRGAIIVENPTSEHIKHLFHRGDIYVQTARYETRTLPVIQAMASSMPIISFPIGLAEDCVETGKNGFIAQNLIQMIAKVDFLRNNPQKTKEFGHNSFLIAKNKYSLLKSISQYAKYFEAQK